MISSRPRLAKCCRGTNKIKTYDMHDSRKMETQSDIGVQLENS